MVQFDNDSYSKGKVTLNLNNPTQISHWLGGKLKNSSIGGKYNQKTNNSPFRSLYNSQNNRALEPINKNDLSVQSLDMQSLMIPSQKDERPLSSQAIYDIEILKTIPDSVKGRSHKPDTRRESSE